MKTDRTNLLAAMAAFLKIEIEIGRARKQFTNVSRESRQSMITINLDNGNCLKVSPPTFKKLLELAEHAANAATVYDVGLSDACLAAQSFIDRARIHRADLRTT